VRTRDVSRVERKLEGGAMLKAWHRIWDAELSEELFGYDDP
jgi:hypothetical protein